MNARSTAIARQNDEIDASKERAIAERAKPRTAIEAMATRLQVSPGVLKHTLMQTAFKGCNEEQFVALVIVSNEYGLNPMLKEIYAFPGKGGAIVPMVGVDGWIKLMNSHPAFDGIEFDYIKGDDGKLFAMEATIWRKDRERPIKVMEILSENKRATDPWKMENRMLRNRTLIQAARIAFGFTGIVAEGEEVDFAPEQEIQPAKRLPSRKTLEEELDDEIPAFDKETGEIIEQDEAKAEPEADLAKDPATGMTEVDEETARALDAGEQQEEDEEEAEESLSDAKLREITEAIAGAKSRNALTAVSQDWYLASAAYDEGTQTRMQNAIDARRSELAKSERKD